MVINETELERTEMIYITKQGIRTRQPSSRQGGIGEPPIESLMIT
jgi:hypothetical protein